MLPEGDDFRMGTFGRLVFCVVRTLIAGEALISRSSKNSKEPNAHIGFSFLAAVFILPQNGVFVIVHCSQK